MLADLLDTIYQRRGEHYRVDLAQKAAIAERLRCRQFACPVITITGTNGKTSCAKALMAIYQQAGLKTGLFTSPHLQRYNERIHINGYMVADDALAEALSDILQATGDAALNFFDISLLAALRLFQQQTLDVIILEVGIGGRYDSTNIIDADVAVITSIGLDHQDMLGGSLGEIAWQKAGIMRANKPVVLGQAMPSIVYDYATQLQAPIYQYLRDFNPLLPANLTMYASNAACALQVVKLLQSRLAVDEQAQQQGLLSAYTPGRLSLYQQAAKPLLLLDVAHNATSFKVLAAKLAALKQQQPSIKRTHAVVAMLADKDHQACLQEVISLMDTWQVSHIAGPRHFTNTALAAIIKQLAPKAKLSLHSSVTEALEPVLSTSDEQDCIVVFGSNYTVAEILNSGLLERFYEDSACS